MEKINIKSILSGADTYARTVTDDFSHKGVDIITMPVDVRSPVDGRVIILNGLDNSSAGKWLAIASSDGNTTWRFLHLSSIVVKSNSLVTKGQLIGKTGRTNGTDKGGNFHLHLEIWKGNRLKFDKTQNAFIINPLDYIDGLTPKTNPTINKTRNKTSAETKKDVKKEKVPNYVHVNTLLSILERHKSPILPVDKADSNQNEFTPYNTITSKNWMNIRHSKKQMWLGEINAVDGFVIFDTVEHSIRAFYRILKSYSYRNIDTIREIADEYLRVEAGDKPQRYVDLMIKQCADLGIKVSPDTIVNDSLTPIYAKVFMFLESSQMMDVAWFKRIQDIYIKKEI